MNQITRTAALLNFTADEIVANYRDAAFSAAHALNFNRIELIKLIRECLAVRAPSVKGLEQYQLALDVLKQEGLL
jgi:hypothetical protein